MISGVGWLERYRDGDRVQVWAEMTSLGVDLRETEEWQVAVEVGRETMRRARANVEHLVEALPGMGYQFEESDRVFAPPEPDVHMRLDHLEEVVGVLPLALRCWYEEVGQVNLTGEHPDWEFDYPDPLVVEAPIDYILSEHEQWKADRGIEWDRRAFVIDLAPDFLHKADVSGGPPYAMTVPNEGVDGLFLWERHSTTFVNYLRISFRWGGFPGWDRGALDGWAKPSGPPPPALAHLADALLLI